MTAPTNPNCVDPQRPPPEKGPDAHELSPYHTVRKLRRVYCANNCYSIHVPANWARRYAVPHGRLVHVTVYLDGCILLEPFIPTAAAPDPEGARTPYD